MSKKEPRLSEADLEMLASIERQEPVHTPDVDERTEGQMHAAARKIVQIMGKDAAEEYMIRVALQYEQQIRAEKNPHPAAIELLDEWHRENDWKKG